MVVTLFQVWVRHSLGSVAPPLAPLSFCLTVDAFVSLDDPVSGSTQEIRRVQDRLPGCWVRMWLWRRVAEENLFPHSRQHSAAAAAAAAGGDGGEDVSATVFSATWVWR